MKLPSLPDLDSFEDESNEEVKSKSNGNKKREDTERKAKKKKEPRVPKTEYDNEGNPKLAIPDLDDVDLSNEIERILGDGG